MSTIAALAALALVATPSGSLIDVSASCSYTVDGTSEVSQPASGYIAVASPAYSPGGKPVFLQNYFRESRNSTGETTVRAETVANGMFVRFLKRNSEGGYTVLDGIQLRDGRVLVDGKPVSRD